MKLKEKAAGRMKILTKFLMINSILPLCVRANVLQYHSGLFGTKTNYVNSYLGDKNVLDHGFTESNIQQIRDKYPELSNIPGCSPVHINGLFRHGTRYPSVEDSNRIKSVLEKMRNANIDAELQSKLDGTALLLYTPEEKSLAKTGVLELNGIGSRFSQRFSEFLKDSKQEDFLFETSSKSRALESGKAFRESFRKQLQEPVQMPKFQIRDDLLRSFDNCSDYIRFVEEDPSYLIEYKEFRNSRRFEEVSEKISSRLGRSMKFTEREIKALFVYAACETSILGSSYWASLFDLDVMLAEEYAADLQFYWRRSYGHRLSYEYMCALLKDIFVHLDNAVIGYKYKKAVLRFAHAETLLPLQTMLGLFNDSDPLLASDFPNRSDRLFRTSTLSPFSGNLAFVLYYCDPDFQVADAKYSEHLSLPPSYDRYMIQLLHKEIPIKFPFSKYDLSKYEDVKKYYKKYLKNCDFEEICGNPPRDNESHDYNHDEFRKLIFRVLKVFQG